ncbi:prenyltransferase/squalene oxidase repeat-containing protein [Amycolatopsis sp. cg5]|uniref:prenyltransferase/squalene oxidase repeat-containing protein n=1 Tax=Amycolatopsis sp. cg5 TaxID=3238802 RepID=UPI003526A2C8
MTRVHGAEAEAALNAGAESLFRRRRPDGGVHFTSSDSATLATAGAAVALHLHSPTPSREHTDLARKWLLRTQNPDGGWGAVPGQPTEAVPTAIAAAALSLLGGKREEPAIARGRLALFERGGLESIADPAVGALCRRFHVMAGWVPADSAVRLPLWIVLLPSLRRKRISFRTAPFIGLALAQAHRDRGGPLRRLVTAISTPVAIGLLRDIHRHEGGTGEFAADPWAAGLLCIGLTQARVAPDLSRGIADYLRSTMNPDGSWPAVHIGLTYAAFAMTGLTDAGFAEDERVGPTAELLRRARQPEPFTAFACPAGGWSYSGPRGWPVTLESAEILSALGALPGADRDEHVTGGSAWLSARQDTRGSWSLWVRDTKLANDGPCPYITAQAIDALRETGAPGAEARIDRALRWLSTQQRPNGSFDALWYRGDTPGTSVVLGAFARAGRAEHPVASRARDWLLRTQLADGAWSTGHGDDGTVEETAWALRALLDAGVSPNEPAVQSAVGWLLAAQDPAGDWPEAPVSAYVRHCVHYPNGAITMGLALRALAAYNRASTAVAS